MAKDGSVQVPRATAPIDKWESFMGSEEGQDIQRLFEQFRSGEKTYDQVYEEYNKKWGSAPAPQTPSQAPQAPLPTLK